MNTDPRQANMFADLVDPRIPAGGLYRGDPERIRTRFAELRRRLDANELDPSDYTDACNLRLWLTITPNMVKWLPDEEAEAIKAEFLPIIEAELAKRRQKPLGWTPRNKASLACIRHFVREAAGRKRWAESVTDEWAKRASDMSAQWAKELRSKSIHRIARDKLDYIRMRAKLGIGRNGTGWPWDRPDHDLWRKLNPHVSLSDMAWER